MKTTVQFLFPLIVFTSCFHAAEDEFVQTKQHPIEENSEILLAENTTQIINSKGENIVSRFSPPIGFRRAQLSENSFGTFLRNLALKPINSKVLYYNGAAKLNHGVYEAVVDLPIGAKDLHQCADAIMRLRADYLWQKGSYNEIHFNFTNGFQVDYSKWMSGNRIRVKGNSTNWHHSTRADTSYESYWKYLETIFTYAGTLSLSKELEKVELAEMEIGDVFIQGGSPGHAVIVVDMVENQEGKKLFMIAQSYMPAQEIQILTNQAQTEISPWYTLNFEGDLYTPEWTFTKSDLKRFKN